jgi:hypothetical protein
VSIVLAAYPSAILPAEKVVLILVGNRYRVRHMPIDHPLHPIHLHPYSAAWQTIGTDTAAQHWWAAKRSRKQGGVVLRTLHGRTLQ